MESAAPRERALDAAETRFYGRRLQPVGMDQIRAQSSAAQSWKST
jgi:hypothetical protein